jgi:uncharacterized membrane protein
MMQKTRESKGNRSSRRAAAERPRLRAAGRASALAFACVLALGAGVAGADAPARSPAPASATLNHDPFPLVSADAMGAVRLPLTELAGGTAHFYAFLAGEEVVEFFVLWTSDNVLRTAFNACDVCYRAKLGYRQDGAFMICQNCGSRFEAAKIGLVSGGCNPAPFAARVEGEELVFSAADLAAGLKYFR